jgi:hypothetical protein
MAPRTQAKPSRITLADLSPDERRALLEEAREEARHNPRDVEGYDALAPRERIIRDLMDARDHSRGCPVQEGERLGRIEGYDARRPPDPVSGAPERWLGVARCAECGGATVLDTTLEQAVEEYEAGLDETAQAADTPDTTL